MTRRGQIWSDGNLGDCGSAICVEFDLLAFAEDYLSSRVFIYTERMRFTTWIVYVCLGIISLQSLTVVGFGIADVQDYPFGDDTPGNDANAIDFGKVIKEVGIEPGDSASEQIQQELGIAYQDEQRATYYVKELINRFLAIAGLVSLIVLIYGFYKMFVAKDNAEAFKEAMNIVKGAAIALVIIGVSRYLVSIMFAVFFEAKQDVG